MRVLVLFALIASCLAVENIAAFYRYNYTLPTKQQQRFDHLPRGIRPFDLQNAVFDGRNAFDYSSSVIASCLVNQSPIIFPDSNTGRCGRTAAHAEDDVELFIIRNSTIKPEHIHDVGWYDPPPYIQPSKMFFPDDERWLRAIYDETTLFVPGFFPDDILPHVDFMCNCGLAKTSAIILNSTFT